MSEDFLSQRVKSALHDFQPEVPAEVYTNMRRKLWLNGFLRWNPSSLNIWYVSFVLAGTLAWAAFPKAAVETPQANPQAAENNHAPAAPVPTTSVVEQPTTSPVNTTCQSSKTASGSADGHTASTDAQETPAQDATVLAPFETTVSNDISEEKSTTTEQAQETKEPETQVGSRSIKIKVVKDGKK